MTGHPVLHALQATRSRLDRGGFVHYDGLL